MSPPAPRSTLFPYTTLFRSEAGDASRWQHEGDNEPTGEKMTESGGYVEVESGIPYETVRELPDSDIFSPVGPLSPSRSEEHTSELQSHSDLVCRLLLEKNRD